MAPEQQKDAAVRLYTPRSSNYDSSWHDDFTRRYISYLQPYISPGQHILDLACGTGLLSVLEADAVGSTGRVIGVDVTPAMLAEARAKKQKEGEKYRHLEFYEGDVLDLDAIDEVKGQTFDIITMASALVLFPDPIAAMKYWTRYLKPGGIIALDSTHPRNLIAGNVLERTGKRLGLPIPYFRNWSTSEDALRGVLASAGLEVEKVVTVENQSGFGRRYYDASAADEVFEERSAVGDAWRTFADEETRRKAGPIFREEWEKVAVDGKVEEIDTVFLGFARKSQKGDSFDEAVVLEGRCRCGNVRYTSAAPPTRICYCYCLACRQLSGSAYLPFVDVPTKSFKYTSSSTLQKLRLSDIAERTFCSSCGTPIAMVYWSEAYTTSVTAGSIDEEKFKAEWPKVRKHIFLEERAPWTELPDDGFPRFSTFDKPL